MRLKRGLLEMTAPVESDGLREISARLQVVEALLRELVDALVGNCEVAIIDVEEAPASASSGLLVVHDETCGGQR